jgi:hypothetical protein
LEVIFGMYNPLNSANLANSGVKKMQHERREEKSNNNFFTKRLRLYLVLTRKSGLSLIVTFYFDYAIRY